MVHQVARKRGDAALVTDTYRELTGETPTSLKEWVAAPPGRFRACRRRRRRRGLARGQAPGALFFKSTFAITRPRASHLSKLPTSVITFAAGRQPAPALVTAHQGWTRRTLRGIDGHVSQGRAGRRRDGLAGAQTVHPAVGRHEASTARRQDMAQRPQQCHASQICARTALRRHAPLARSQQQIRRPSASASTLEEQGERCRSRH